MEGPATKEDLKAALRVSELRVAIMLFLMVVVLLAAVMLVFKVR